MLYQSAPSSAQSSRPSSPRRRLGQPRPSSQAGHLQPSVDTGFLEDREETSTSHGISSSAFSPNYFETFFVEEGVLGKGGKGVVLLVRHVLDGVSLGHFACKRVPVGDDHEWLEKVLVEVQLLQNLSHQNLVSYRHMWLENYQITTFGPSVPCAFILQQYCNSGDLLHYILESTQSSVSNAQLKEQMRRRSRGQAEPPVDLHAPRRMHFEEIYSFFKDITSGLHHLHTNGYIHRDLKPSNCLLHTTGNMTRVLVSDFGEMQMVNVARKSTGATGTISYCAPEVLQRESPDGPFGNFTTSSDIFSLGMIVYFMCFGRLPYDNADEINEENEDLDQLREEIVDWAGFDDERRVRADLPEKLYKFLRQLLSVDPLSRPSTGEILRGIQAGWAIDELAPSGQPPFGDGGSRITSVETPPSSATPSLSARLISTPQSLAKAAARLKRPAESSRVQSPLRHEPTSEEDNDEVASSLILRPRKVDLRPSQSPIPQPGPRLILPPPANATARVYQFFSVPVVVGLGKIVLFLLKLLSVSSPCSPFAANPWIAYPLLLLATADFSIFASGSSGARFGTRFSVILLAFHIVVLAFAVRFQKLCLRKPTLWESSDF